MAGWWSQRDRMMGGAFKIREERSGAVRRK